MPKRDQLRRLMAIDRQVRGGLCPHPDTLAEELEVSRRVIFNDRAYMVNVLRAPLKFSRERNGWHYTETTWVLPAALVTRGELLAFLLCVEAATRQLGPALENELRAAVEKIGSSLQGRVEVDLESLRRHWSFAAPTSAAASERVLLLLHEAIGRQKVVAMTYFTASRNQETQRHIEPHHLHNAGGDWYVFAFDHGRAKMLTFNAGRIADISLLERSFARQEDFSPEAFLEGGFRTELGPQLFEVAVRFDASQAIYIRERRWHETQTIEELAEGGLILRLRASGLGEIVRWVLQYGSHAEVLSPPELRDLVQTEIERMARAYIKERGDEQ